jgi:antitoxin MazE
MTAMIQKWGNSQGLRLPKKTLSGISLSVGDCVELSRDGDRIIITPIKQKKRYDICELVARIPSEYVQPEEAFGKPMGLEEW